MDRFDLNDFRTQIDTMKNIGPMRDLLAKIPGMGPMGLENLGGIDFDEEVMRIQGIIDSMTSVERKDPGQIDRSRRRRIAEGSGSSESEVAFLIRQFDAMADVLRGFEKRKFRW
jgi:signal recognition particle subunit SRP54